MPNPTVIAPSENVLSGSPVAVAQYKTHYPLVLTDNSTRRHHTPPGNSGNSYIESGITVDLPATVRYLLVFEFANGGSTIWRLGDETDLAAEDAAVSSALGVEGGGGE